MLKMCVFSKSYCFLLGELLNIQIWLYKTSFHCHIVCLKLLGTWTTKIKACLFATDWDNQGPSLSLHSFLFNICLKQQCPVGVINSMPTSFKIQECNLDKDKELVLNFLNITWKKMQGAKCVVKKRLYPGNYLKHLQRA